MYDDLGAECKDCVRRHARGRIPAGRWVPVGGSNVGGAVGEPVLEMVVGTLVVAFFVFAWVTK